MNDNASALQSALSEASTGRPAKLENFLRLLLRSTVFIPLKTSQNQLPENTLDVAALMVLESHGRKVVPFFSSASTAQSWGGEEIFLQEKELKTLLWLVPDDYWIYLDPGQEIGKEFSPWEIQELRKGESAVSEVAQDLAEDYEEELDIDDQVEDLRSIKARLCTIFEAYPEIKEAFLIRANEPVRPDGIKQVELPIQVPILGLRHENISLDRLEIVVDEVKVMTSTEPHGVVIVPDLSQKSSPNAYLFKSARPFYVAPGVASSNHSTIQQFRTQLRSLMSKVFGS